MEEPSYKYGVWHDSIVCTKLQYRSLYSQTHIDVPPDLAMVWIRTNITAQHSTNHFSRYAKAKNCL
jgi:hypothetical protein